MNSDSSIDVNNPVAHDDQDLLLRDAAQGSFLQSKGGKRLTRIGAIALVGILILGVVAGIVIGFVGARHVAPYVSLVSTTTAKRITTAQPGTMTQSSTTAHPTTTAQPSTTAQPRISKTAQPPTPSTSTKPVTTEPSIFVPGQFPPPTTHPMPKDPLDYPPVSLLIDTGMNPKFVEVECAFAHPPVFKYNVTITDHTFTSSGANTKHLAKDAVAMVANEVIFGLKYPSIPVPTSKCTVVVPSK